MSIATEISRIQTDRDKIRAKLVTLGLAEDSDNLTKLATAVESIKKHEAISATVLEGSTYTIPAGYHDGSGTVTGLSDTAGDAEKYKLQAKTGIIPTKQQQTISPDSGNYGLSSVTIEPIPTAYQNVSSVDASASDVLVGKTIVTSDGTVTAGTMPNNGNITAILGAGDIYKIPEGYHNGKGAVEAASLASQTSATADATQILEGETAYVNGVEVTGTMVDHTNGADATLTTTTTEYTIPQGYHSGLHKVSIDVESKSATPNDTTQTIKPSSGKVLSSVTVNPVPSDYVATKTSDATATSGDILPGKTAYVNGEKVTGNMPVPEVDYETFLDVTNQQFVIPEGYHNGMNSVKIDIDDSHTGLNAVQPTKSVQLISAAEGKVMVEVAVAPIPDKYQDVSGVTAIAGQVMDGFKFVTKDGTLTEGTMPYNGPISQSINGLTDDTVVIPEGYTSGGTVTLTSDIEDALKLI